MNKLDKLQEKIGYKFKNVSLLKTALTHSSYINEVKGAKCYERMEFLGDSVLSVVVSEYIFNHLKTSSEGDLSKIRASVVCEEGLDKIAAEIGIGECLYLSRGEELNGGRERKSIIADAVEAVFAGIFLDGGMDEAKRVILNFTVKYINEYSGKNPKILEYKTRLQEYAQEYAQSVEYTLVSQSGPDHDKRYVYAVSVDGKKCGEGKGKSKKTAEQAAAKEACMRLGIK